MFPHARNSPPEGPRGPAHSLALRFVSLAISGQHQRLRKIGKTVGSAVSWVLASPLPGCMHMLFLCLQYSYFSYLGILVSFNFRFKLKIHLSLATKSEIAIYSPYPSPLPHSSQSP